MALLLALLSSGDSAIADLHRQPGARHPIGLLRVGNDVLIVNRRAGSISVLSSKLRKIVNETRVARRLAAVVAVPGRGNRLLAIDDARQELLLLELAFTEGGYRFRRISQIRVPASPRGVVAFASGQAAIVSSTWARRLTHVSLKNDQLRVLGRTDVPFAPMEMQLVNRDRHLVVAGAFDGRLALVDAARRSIQRVHELQGHKLRGLLLHNGTLWMPQQLLFSKNYTSREAVHWGGVLKNVVRRVPVSRLLAGQISRVAAAGETTFLGYPDEAAGDPESFLLTKSGRKVVALAGVNQVAISEPEGAILRVPVGSRPSDLLLDTSQTHVWVANRLSDTISFVRLKRPRVIATVALGPPRKLTIRERGERLFHNAELSSDGWFSCHSCHVNGHTNHRLNDNFSDQSAGAPKRVLSLHGVAQTGPWAWNGQVDSLKTQVTKSILHTMQGPKPKPQQVEALVAYLRSLPPVPSLLAARGESKRPAVGRGKRLFDQLRCTKCHARPQFTSAGTYDVGLADQHGQSEFNPPSLLGVSHRQRLFHDNRANSLDEVVRKFKHKLPRKLTAGEERDLILYLQSL